MNRRIRKKREKQQLARAIRELVALADVLKDYLLHHRKYHLLYSPQHACVHRRQNTLLLCFRLNAQQVGVMWYNYTDDVNAADENGHLSRQIIESHGGKIWLESRLNKGSEFSFLNFFYQS